MRLGVATAALWAAFAIGALGQQDSTFSSGAQNQPGAVQPPPAAPANADGPFLPGNYFSPDELRVASGRPFRVRYLTAPDDAATPAPWPSAGLEWVFVRGEGTQANLHFVKPTPGSDALDIPLEPAGWQMVGIDSKGAAVRVARDMIEAKLNAAGAKIPATRGPGAPDSGKTVRLLHTESTKFIVRVEPPAGAAPGPETAAVVMSKSGQAAEIRLMTDPTTAGVGDLIAFCAYVEGSRQSDVRVVARNLDTSKPAPILAGGGGVSSFRVSEAGTWQLEFTFAQAADDNSGADWITYHGTLTFETGTGAGAKGGGK